MTPAARERAVVRTPMLLVSAAAWALLGVQSFSAGPHAHHARMSSATSALAFWLAMLPAMMAPVIIPAVRHVRASSFARRQPRSIALFLAGYISVWTVAGAALLPLVRSSLTYVPALIAAVAVAWHCSPWKQRCINRCHAHPPLAAFGSAADLDAFRFGISHGVMCVGSCSGPMLLPMLVSHSHLLAMACTSLWIAAERVELPSEPAWQFRTPRRALRIVTAFHYRNLDRAYFL